jgi:type IV pilus assembly protein PilV
MMLRCAHRRQTGFSMLEVLIAVLVFSLGMIGLAGLLIFSIRSNHVAYLRTQATFLAHNMANRMGANPAGLWNGDYNISKIDDVGAAIPSCASGCDPQSLAKHDIAAWSQQLHTFLPAAHASISCAKASGYSPSASEISLRPPYGGTCTMKMSWNEAGAAGGANRTSLQANVQQQQQHTFAWMFQP